MSRWMEATGPEGWKTVASRYQIVSGEAVLRFYDDVRRHFFTKLCKNGKRQTGLTNKSAPLPQVARAQEIYRKKSITSILLVVYNKYNPNFPLLSKISGLPRFIAKTVVSDRSSGKTTACRAVNADRLNPVTARNDPSSAFLNKVIHGEKQ